MKAGQAQLTKGGVLLMGCDAGLKQSVRCVLQAENYEVLPAARGEEAEELLEAASVDILVVDVDNLPGGVGPLVTRLRAKHPQLRTVGIRGPRSGAAQTDAAAVTVWVEKPLDSYRLGAAVNNLLAELRSEIFRERLIRRQTVPLFSSASYRHWGLNE